MIGFDTGPGNTLLDAWIQKHRQQSHDKNGAWATQGTVQHNLLKECLSDPYFKLTPPKSTGREHFNLAWIEKYLQDYPHLAAEDIQATLVELTAQSIVDAIRLHITEGEILVCGGGIHNTFLMSRLTALAKEYTIASTEKRGIQPDWVEAIAFAWLAKQTLSGEYGNLPAVTGAKCAAILGGIYYEKS